MTHFGVLEGSREGSQGPQDPSQGVPDPLFQGSWAKSPVFAAWILRFLEKGVKKGVQNDPFWGPKRGPGRGPRTPILRGPGARSPTSL